MTASPETERVAGAARRTALLEHRERLERDLRGRFWLRAHASLIVTGTFAAGFVANFVLLELGLHAVLQRWLLAIALGYAMFFALVRLWLAYIGLRAVATPDGTVVDGVDWVRSANAVTEPVFRGGGGSSGGGGASGSFGEVAGVSRSASAKGIKGVAALDLVDGDAAMLVIVISVIVLALVAVLAGGAVHFIWMAPELLTDAAFAALLASGALPGLRRLRDAHWSGSIFRATWKSLLAVVIVASAASVALTHYFPGALTIGAAWRSIR